MQWAAEISPLFAVELAVDDEPSSWRPATALCAAGPELLGLVAMVGERLGAREQRVAASLTLMGYAARLVSPTAAVLLRAGLLLDVRPAAVRWRYRREAGFQLAMPAVTASPVGAAEAAAAAWSSGVVDGHLRLVVESVRQVTPIAAGLLWGNVASSLAGALRTLALDGGVPVAACRAAGDAMLARGPLRGTGELTTDRGRLSFVRRSCCLYYRLPGGGLCGDCPLPRTGGAGRR